MDNVYIKTFNEYIGDNNVIRALSALNADILAYSAIGRVNEEEVKDFYEYFTSKYNIDENMEQCFYEEWGQYPLILRMGKGLLKSKKR